MESIAKGYSSAQDNWKVVEDGFVEPESIVGYTNAYNNALKVAHTKVKVVLYILYWAIDEFGFEKIANVKSSNEAWNILEKACKRERPSEAGSNLKTQRKVQEHEEEWD